jgi:CDP-2,3-bis-(O-geranylgeranyl)-sn-glycerol synthase
VLAMLVKPLKFLFIPIDNNLTYQGKPIFGTHKTWLGLISGSLTGLLTAILIYPYFDISYPVILGFFMGFSSIVGDMVKSFFKRRMDIKPGQPWIPFDQIDYMLANIIIFSAPLALNLFDISVLIVLGFFSAIIISLISWTIGIKEKVF